MRQKPIDIRELGQAMKDRMGSLEPSGELIITKNDRPIARIVPIERPQPVFGQCKGMLSVIEEDDEHLVDFKEYMP